MGGPSSSELKSKPKLYDGTCNVRFTGNVCPDVEQYLEQMNDGSNETKLQGERRCHVIKGHNNALVETLSERLGRWKRCCEE